MQVLSGPGRVLVTGASGFLGRYVARDLLAHGWAVRGLARPRSGVLDPGVEVARVEGLHDRPGLRRACTGMDAVIHLAARVHDESAAEEEYRRTNVDGTRAVAEEAAAAGVRVVVFASSVKAVGETSPDSCWDDSVVPRPVDPYGASKLAAEEALRAVADAAALHAPILRLPLVYGAGVRANMLRVFRAVDRGFPLPLGGVRNRRSLLFAGNLAAAVRAVLSAPAVARETLLVSDGKDFSTPELIRAIAHALGRPARLLPFPPPLLRLAGRAGDALSSVVPLPLTSAAVERLLGSLCVDCSRLRALTGWAPPFTPEEGLGEAAAWYRARAA